RDSGCRLGQTPHPAAPFPNRAPAADAHVDGGAERFPGQGKPPCGAIRDPLRCFMSRVCQVTGTRTTSGNTVSHAMNNTRRRFMPSLHERRFWVASEDRWVKLRVSTKGLRTIDKNGIDAVLADLRKRGEKI